MESHTKVSCEAYIVRNGQLLLGKRKNAHGAGTWGMPGGHLMYLERADTCLIREVLEETGIAVLADAIKLLAVTDGIYADENNHYLHLTFAVDIANAEPQLTEPHKCEGWQWFALDALPNDIFRSHALILQTIASGDPYHSS